MLKIKLRMNLEEKEKFLISVNCTALSAMQKLDNFHAVDSVLFVVNEEDDLLGTITDGDIRRGLLTGNKLDSKVRNFMNLNYRFLIEHKDNVEDFKLFKSEGINLVPVINKKKKIVSIVNLSQYEAFLPVDVLLMAGGVGKRLRPLTNSIPKPMLKIGEKPIIEHNIDRLAKFGVKKMNISINYLGESIKNYFGNGSKKGLSISYIEEEQCLGTIGSIKLVPEIFADIFLVMNSDLLTNINYKDFYLDFIESGADMGVASIPYNIDVPYAVMEVDENNLVENFKEKPTYTYFSNAGIYLIRKKLIDFIPSAEKFDATDLMAKIISSKEHKLFSFSILGYWRDIGRIEDYENAKKEIYHIDL